MALGDSIFQKVLVYSSKTAGFCTKISQNLKPNFHNSKSYCDMTNLVFPRPKLTIRMTLMFTYFTYAVKLLCLPDFYFFSKRLHHKNDNGSMTSKILGLNPSYAKKCCNHFFLAQKLAIAWENFHPRMKCIKFFNGFLQFHYQDFIKVVDIHYTETRPFNLHLGF